MKVILITDVKKVGRKGEVHEVAAGYAMNVLIPNKLALPGTPENIKKLEKENERRAEKQAYQETLLAENIKELDGKALHIKARSNEKGALFQIIRARHIADAIQSSFGIVVPESGINTDAIQSTGEYTVPISGGGASASLAVSVS